MNHRRYSICQLCNEILNAEFDNSDVWVEIFFAVPNNKSFFFRYHKDCFDEMAGKDFLKDNGIMEELI